MTRPKVIHEESHFLAQRMKGCDMRRAFDTVENARNLRVSDLCDAGSTVQRLAG